MSSLTEIMGWTLIHFVWQGGAIALAIAAALRIVRRRSANARYLVACTGLTLMLAAPEVVGNARTPTIEVDVIKLELRAGAPLKSTTAPLTNLEPVTVTTTVVPSVPEDGDTLFTIGFDDCTVSVAVLDSPPPGVGFDT